MSKAEAALCSGLDEEQATRVVALLLAMGITPHAETSFGAGGDIRITVASADLERARRLLDEEFPDGLERHGLLAANLEAAEPAAAPPEHWFGRGTGVLLALAAACVVVLVASLSGPDAGSRSRLLDLGAISWAAVERGEVWRLLTAIFLHFDVGHLAANMLVLLLVGPPLAHQLGPLRFLLVFLATGVAANAISHVVSPTLGLKGGASGSIAGLLGALGGQALRPDGHGRYRSWQILGALAAIYGLVIGFGPGRDNTAHVAGLAAGLALGRVLRPLPDERRPAAPREPLHRPRPS